MDKPLIIFFSLYFDMILIIIIIEVSTNIQAFIQTQVLKRTWESIRVDLREDIMDDEYGQMEV